MKIREQSQDIMGLFLGADSTTNSLRSDNTIVVMTSLSPTYLVVSLGLGSL
jgi:hypothetical protein